MKPILLVVLLGLGMLLIADAARGQRDVLPPREPPEAAEANELRREIVALEQLIEILSTRLESLQRRLAKLEGPQPKRNPPLRFPIDVERAMMVPPEVPSRHLEGFELRLHVPFQGIEIGPRTPLPPGPLDQPKLPK